MNLTSKNPIVLILLCLMTGIFITVSFLETPMKFQVTGMTLPVALELGILMFGISTKIQCVCLIFILAGMLISRKVYTNTDFIIIIVIFTLLLLEILWMLPVLNNRAHLLSEGKPVSSSEIHNYFIYAESAKAFFLSIAIILQFSKQRQSVKN